MSGRSRLKTQDSRLKTQDSRLKTQDSIKTPLTNRPPHLGPILDDRSKRERFAPQELAIVLSHYDLSVIREIRTYARGSRRAPKLRLDTARGQYLLKRRAPGRDDPYRVAFTHAIQLRLGEQMFPVPRLIGTRTDNNSMVQLNGRIYELFEFVTGERYDGSPGATARAGAALGALHRLLEGFQTPFEGPRGSFHAAPDVESAFSQLGPAISAVEPDAAETELDRMVSFLRAAYHDAAGRVGETGYRERPATFLHGDWHPGNLLYREGAVVAVLDFDSARLEPRMADVANGALQFSMVMTSRDDPRQWPDSIEVERLRTFLHGYDASGRSPLEPGELASIPWLMIEALVFESIVPIAATGSFARIPGSRFLAMVERKVRWLRGRADKLVRFLEETKG